MFAVFASTVRFSWSNPAALSVPFRGGWRVGGWLRVSLCYGGHSVEETPGSIPNPEAKLDRADGTALGRVWESRSPPDIFIGSGGVLSPCGVFASSTPFFSPKMGSLPASRDRSAASLRSRRDRGPGSGRARPGRLLSRICRRSPEPSDPGADPRPTQFAAHTTGAPRCPVQYQESHAVHAAGRSRHR